ncbi:hypothetical protein SASPL_111720 [Salvia splendens]|uniref:Late embryogenesis abundant protein LEA-2 subgroup domain-containing protein n=1 Tax=Salvia splendens TaxID=180675 RepID=A0A8X8YCF9_SALSN|nr:hypothetical protein SASPL_111720 [Salvia splendens]
MAERREQEEPLAPAILANSKLSPFPPEFISHRRHQCLKCCGCSAALPLILVVTTLILMLTIFHVKHPSLEIISVKIDSLNSLSNNNNPTLVASVSIKNPNAVSFKFHEAATEVYYDGALVGRDILKLEFLKKRQSLEQDVGRKKFFKHSKIEQKRLQRLREEEKRESEAKALPKKQLQQDHQSKDTKSFSLDPNSNTDNSKSKPKSSSSKSLVEEQNIDNLNLEGNE